MKLTARGRAGHGSMINPDNAVTRISQAVARLGAHEWPVRLTPAMEVLLATVADLAGTEATPGERRGAGRGVRQRRPDARRGHPQHHQPDRCSSAGYKANVDPDRGDGAGRRPLPARASRTSSSRPSPSSSATGSRSSTSPTSTPWETPYDGDAGRRDAPLAAGRGPRRAGRAVPDERRHRRQALPQARHALLRLHAAAAAAPTSTSPRCSTASTSGCRSTRWSSGRGSSTGSSTRSERWADGSDRTAPLPDDLAPQHHPAGAVGRDLHAGRAPSRRARPGRPASG